VIQNDDPFLFSRHAVFPLCASHHVTDSCAVERQICGSAWAVEILMNMSIVLKKVLDKS
jgi:hypothetical protein